mmetsp:Transcript_2516/g.3779  ORF Transcript_2516/g.3779 Transcript_2516/m.3779 type:complete len:421 (-) Transcript_2516:23-1285(-)
MGLGNNGSKVLYSLKLPSRANVATIAVHLRQSEITSADPANHSASDRPVIYVDANNVINVVSRKAVDPVAHTANFLKEWSQEGFIVVPVCDGPRPQSKQQTNKSRAVRQKAKHKSVILRQDLRRISQQLKDGGVDAATRKRLEDEQAELCKSIKSAETQSVNVVPPNFPMLLEEELNKISAHDKRKGGGSVAPVVTAMFEADALIKGAFMNKKFQLVMSNDADYPADLGDKCIAIKEFGTKDLVISSTSKVTLEKAMSSLGNESNANLKVPPHPIYEGVVHIKMRALISVIIGCDVCPGGLPGIAPKTLASEIAKLKESSANNEDIYNNLLAYAVKSGPPSFSEEVLTTFVNAIVYQPTNEFGCEGERTYISDAPQELPGYLQEFKSAATIMESGPDVLECKGSCYGHSHNFLGAMKHHQ